MDVKGRELGPDDAEAVLDLPSLNELAEIDRDRYTIVGIDLRVDGPTTAIETVYAIDGLEHSTLCIDYATGRHCGAGPHLPRAPR